MRHVSMLATAFVAGLLVAVLGWTPGCGGSHSGSGFAEDDSGQGSNPSASGGSGSSGSGSSGSSLDLGGSSSGSSSTARCPAGLECNVSCQGGSTTTITGKVYDPAGRNPLYNIVVYVPAAPLQPLPTGVPTGADACSCPALYKSGEVVITTTSVDGTFKLTNAPVGTSVPLVIQVGKWRRLFHINVSACKDNAQPDKTLLLPSTVAAGDTNDNMPEIAVSTGSADSLECLMTRIGLPSTEYVAGTGGSGHVHIFAGGKAGGGGRGGGVGTAENPGMTGALPAPRACGRRKRS
jgi:hypothetical protein